MCEVIACCRHDEVKITIDFLAITLGNNGLKGSSGLLECDARAGFVAAELAQSQA